MATFNSTPLRELSLLDVDAHETAAVALRKCAADAYPRSGTEQAPMQPTSLGSWLTAQASGSKPARLRAAAIRACQSPDTVAPWLIL